jgi:hypothetical protein
METTEQNKLTPSFNQSFGNGWKTMEKYFLVLLLIVIVVGVVSAPAGLFKWNIDPSHFKNWNWNEGWRFPFPDFGMMAFGAIAVVMGLFALAYSLLIIPVFKFGSKMMFVQAVRDTKPDFETLVKGFKENYLSIVLANLLATALVMLGFFALIIPGIIIACRLAFVSYLVMDKKLDPIAAVEQSWKLTGGHGWTIFSMGLVSFFIYIAGFCLCFVGIFPASIWVGSSFASLYEAVLNKQVTE